MNNTVVERYSYDVFGEPTIRNTNDEILSTSSVNNPYLFTGRRFDNETGLYYYRARYYAYDIGRFLQTDPIGYADGINWYIYVGNNPARYVDPSGLAYFASRPLEGSPWIPVLSHNPLDDHFNTEFSHEQIFFEDAEGGNIGFFNDNTLQEEVNPTGYRVTGSGYDDNLLRQAVENVDPEPYHLLYKWSRDKNKYNCQDWCADVRKEYTRLLRDYQDNQISQVEYTNTMERANRLIDEMTSTRDQLIDIVDQFEDYSEIRGWCK